MKAILRKELRQGRAVVVFAIGMAGALVVTRLLLVALGNGWDGAGRPTHEWRAAITPYDGAITIALLCLPAVLALFSGVGLFASEAEHGTLPVLFMLPFSRQRIWAAKLLAGAQLAAVSSLIVLLTGKFLMGPAFPFVGITPWLDMGLVTIYVLAVTMFVTVLTPHVVGAVMAAAALTVGLFIAVMVGSAQTGLLLFGYDRNFDLEVWMALAAPALLFASWRAVAKGELLEARRTSLLQLPLLIVGLAVTVGVAHVVGRGLTGYDRGSVGAVAVSSAEPGAKAVVLLADSRPVAYARAMFWPAGGARAMLYGEDRGQPLGVGWVRRRGAQNSELLGGGFRGLEYRNRSAVVLDLKTGRERAVVRESLSEEAAAAVSQDGRYAAVAVAPVGVTWGEWPEHSARRLEVIDLESGRRWYDGTPMALDKKGSEQEGVSAVAWSPSGESLAFTTGGAGSGGGGSLQVMRRDGSEQRTLQARSSAWTWGPRGEVLYLVEAGALMRAAHDLAAERVWPAEGDEGQAVRTLTAEGFSPDGAWVVLTAAPVAKGFPAEGRGGATRMGMGGRRGGFGRGGGRRGPGGARVAAGGASGSGGSGAAVAEMTATELVAARTEGKQSQMIWRGKGTWLVSLAWQGGALYALVTRSQQSLRRPVTAAQLLRWRPGEEKATELQASVPYPNARLAAVAGQGVLLWPAPRRAVNEATRQEEEVPSPVGPALLTGDGVLRPFPNARVGADYARMNSYITIDDAGRLITRAGYEVAATDLRTGARRVIYP